MSETLENWRRKGENFSGLKWAGRRKDGVSKWRGTWRNGPPLGFCRFFLGFTIFFVVVGSIALVNAALVETHPSLSIGLVMLFASIIYTAVTYFSYRQRDKFLRLQEPSVVAEELGMSQEELERLTEERDIKPDLYFNDVPLYDPNKLVAAKVLLRASAQPINSEILLRAASPAPSATETDQLLRASTGE